MLAYYVVDQDLHEVLTGIGEQLGIRVSVSSQVGGRVRGRLPLASAANMLARLGTLYGFDWYYSRGTLFISNVSETTSKVIALGATRFEDLAKSLEDLGIADERWPLRSSTSGVAVASGPPAYLAMVDETLSALAKRTRPDTVTVRVFRGSAASPP